MTSETFIVVSAAARAWVHRSRLPDAESVSGSV